MTPQEAVEQLIHETECLRAENAQLRGELTEARKQPVRLLPTVTTQMIDEACDAPMPLVQAMNTVLARHFCEAAKARVKPTLDVEAVAKEINEKWLYDSQLMITVREAAVHVLRAHVTDAPAQPLQETQQLDEAKLRREIAQYLRQNGERIETGELTVLEVAHEIERGSAFVSDAPVVISAKDFDGENVVTSVTTPATIPVSSDQPQQSTRYIPTILRGWARGQEDLVRAAVDLIAGRMERGE